MTIPTGGLILASQLNALTGIKAHQVGDTAAVNNSTVLVNTGITAPVDANATYAALGWMHYAAAAAGDIKFGLSLPSGATGRWGGAGPYPAADPVGGGTERINYTDWGVDALTSTQAMAGDDDAVIFTSGLLVGFIATAATAGNVVVQFAQNTAAVHNTIVKAGSWLILFKLA